VIKIIFTISLLTAPIFLMGQNSSGRILLRNSGVKNNKERISIKWYSKELYYTEGVNIYRKEGLGEWKKLNEKIIKKMSDLSASAYKQEPDLNFFVPFINENKKESMQGLFFINVLVKSFQSEAFSGFLGIQYEDTTVHAGKSYRYKVNKIKGNAELLIGESSAIIAGPESIEEPIKDISIKPDTNKVKMKWKVEEQRFYAVNIYRYSANKIWKLVNKIPVMISGFKDSVGRLQYPKNFFIDDSLHPGFYTYQLAGLDFFGKETKRSESFKVEVKDLIPPPLPQGLKDSISNMNVTLKWTIIKSGDIAGINIYRSIKSAGPFLKLNSSLLPPATTFYKDKVEKAGPYYYYVSSVDAAGNESKSDPIFSEVYDIIPPAQPLGLTAKADTNKIYLSWQKNKEGDVAGYLIYRTINKNNNNNFALLNASPVKETSFRDNLPKNARNNFLYKIIAIDSSYNKSKSSDMVSVRMPDVIPPVRPYLKSINNSETYVIIKWLSNKDADLKGYNIYRSVGNEKYSLLNKTLIVPSRDNYIDPNIESGKTYFYYIIAIDSAGNQSQSSNTLKGFYNFTTLSSVGLTDFKIKYREEKQSIHLSWKQENIKGILGFLVYCKEGDIERIIPISKKTGMLEYYDKNVISGKTYYYQIRAYDKAGAIAKSETMKISIK
jgi:uncharacterized protein